MSHYIASALMEIESAIAVVGMGGPRDLVAHLQSARAWLRRAMEGTDAPEVLAWSRPQLSERMTQAIATAEVAALFGEADDA